MSTPSYPPFSSLPTLKKIPIFLNPKSPFSHISSPINPKTLSNKSPINLKTPLSQNSCPLLPPLHSSSTTPSTTTSNSLKARLKNGETLYGIFILSFSPTIAEIAGLAGYDFAVVDMEHGFGGIADALECIRALAASRTPVVLRLPESSAVWAKKALDLGPQGIMFPMIDSPKEARKAVSYCRFPPKGIRGSAHTVVRASDYGIDEGYLGNYEEELLVMCQVESGEGVERIEEIAGIDGVDCVQMGPLDLSASLGYLWDPGHKKVKEMMRKAENGVMGTTKKGGNGGAFLAGFAMPHDGAENLRLRGYRMVSGAVDVGLFRNAAVEDVRKFKMGLDRGSDHEMEEEKDGDEKYWSE
ncbi:aldolase [Lithospermum erythrorhizon]|uniref:Aldolase n=1 Tax=Lithospermum erythrorhizon TaxID=34254 RepID=A0AAV3RPE1_LITER